MSAARRLHAKVPILVRVQRLGDIAELRERGASEVLAGELETALEAVSRVLRSADLPEATVSQLLETLRRDHPHGHPPRDTPPPPTLPPPPDGGKERAEHLH